MNDNLQYNKETRKGVLGTLSGPIASVVRPTRNGRKYSEGLWTKVFKNPIVLEQFKNGGILGELGHPTDRSETDMEKIAICMPEPPKKNEKGLLESTFDILDTPNGRIAKCLADYGYKLGVSSRGTGDVIENLMTGEEDVDENTYDFQAFDLVIIPACEDARLNLITESLENKKALNESLNTLLESANDKDKAIMTETLKELNIDYSSAKENDIKDEDEVTTDTVDNAEVDVVKNLQEALNKNRQLEEELAQLNAQISVCNAKEEEHKVLSEKYQRVVLKLAEVVNNVSGLENKISELSNEISLKESKIQEQAELVESLSRKQKTMRKEAAIVSENMKDKTNNIKLLESKVSNLRASLKEKLDTASKENDIIKEELETLKKDSLIKNNEYQAKLKDANKLVEKYQKLANNVIDRYINLQATNNGVRPEEIKNKLTEGYTLNDIDKVCDDLQQYKINISKLPINFSKQNVKITESKESILPANRSDEIDDFLLKMAGLE